MKYLYILNYFEQFETSLCQKEFEVIFQEPMVSRYYFSDIDYDFTRSVFFKERLTIMYEAPCVEEIVERIKHDQLYYEKFKVIYYKNKITHLDYQTSLNYCRQLSEPIDGSTDMEHPEVEFALTKIHDTYYFGLLQRNMGWHKHEIKPYSYSHSLPLRVARTAINLGLGRQEQARVIDPCCGVGTVVLEGLSMGLDIYGSDINRYVAYHARLNLAHFGYDPLRIERKDIHDITEHYDLAIVDVPYGVYAPFPIEKQLDLIQAAHDIADRVVIITHLDLEEDIKALGYEIEHTCFYRKANFMRYLITARSL